MKTLMLAMASALWAANAPAADPRTFEGVNLEELGQTQRLRDLPEIYERPANEPRFRMHPAVIQVPLGEAWLSFNADRNVSYLNKVPGENPATYFGPLSGDAFDIFKLEEKFIASLRKDYAPDVSYRLALMVRTGNTNLRQHALRIMIAGLAQEVSVRTRTSHLPRFSELAAGLEGEDVAPLRAAIAATEKSIDEATPTFPDSAYGPGNDELAQQGKLQDWMKPSVPVPDTAWGEPLNGLRAAAVFSTTTPRLDQDISVWLLVENASDHEIRFSTSDVMQGAHPKITGPDGQDVPVKRSWFTGLSPILRHKLRPGERLTLAKKSLVFDDREKPGQAGFGQNRVAAEPQDYRVRYVDIHGTGSAKREWGGRLSTAETKISVAASLPAGPPVTGQEIKAMPACKLTAGPFGTCWSAFTNAEGKRVAIGSPGSTLEVVRFLQTLEEGKTYSFPEAFLEFEQYPTYETGDELKAMPPCTASAVSGGISFLFLRTADGKGFWLGKPWRHGEARPGGVVPPPRKAGETEEVLRFVQGLEEGKSYDLPGAFLKFQERQQKPKP